MVLSVLNNSVFQGKYSVFQDFPFLPHAPFRRNITFFSGYLKGFNVTFW